MRDHPLLAYFAAHQDEMLDLVRALVTQETPSRDKPRLDAFAVWLATRLRQVGAEVEIIPAVAHGDHVIARYAHDRFPPGTAQALVLCHYDTVWPVGSLATHPFRIEGDKAYGPGIFDMQSSLMLAEYALRALVDLELDPPRPITVLITSDEEVGSPTAWPLIEAEARAAAYVLVMESPLPGGVLKTARKGVGRITLTIAGRAAHAGVEPEQGASAIQELAHQILALHSFTDYAQGSTVNVGVVQGGSVANVVAAQARAEVDLRAWSQTEADRLLAAVHSLTPVTPGVQISLSGGWNRPPLERKVSAELFGRAQAIGRELGLELREGSTGGGSDGNITGSLGIPTLDGLGVPGHGAHADHEHIEVGQIAGRAALLTALLMQF